MALAALKRWTEAEEFFELVVSAPGQVPSALQLEALKKLVLVQLIAKGKVDRQNLVNNRRSVLMYFRRQPLSRNTPTPSSYVSSKVRHIQGS